MRPRELEALYKAGKNVSAALREEAGTDENSERIIEVAYDLQAGSYVRAMESPVAVAHKDRCGREIAGILRGLCEPASVLEAGVGEATTFASVLRHLGGDALASYGFDLAWSRVAYARRWLAGQGLRAPTLCTGSLLHIPFADASIDVVYTFHTIEPNGGRERPILEELYRVARRFVVLFEPGYELASHEARRRMESHGYCRGLRETAEGLGYDVRAHALFPLVGNPLNPTAVTIIAKPEGAPSTHVLACPTYKTALREIGGLLFSPEALCVYPVLDGIPCLRPENAIVASHYAELVAG